MQATRGVTNSGSGSISPGAFEVLILSPILGICNLVIRINSVAKYCAQEQHAISHCSCPDAVYECEGFVLPKQCRVEHALKFLMNSNKPHDLDSDLTRWWIENAWSQNWNVLSSHVSEPCDLVTPLTWTTLLQVLSAASSRGPGTRGRNAASDDARRQCTADHVRRHQSVGLGQVAENQGRIAIQHAARTPPKGQTTIIFLTTGGLRRAIFVSIGRCRPEDLVAEHSEREIGTDRL